MRCREPRFTPCFASNRVSFILDMSRLIPIFLLALLVGCASPSGKQAYWNEQRAEWKSEQNRLHDRWQGDV